MAVGVFGTVGVEVSMLGSKTRTTTQDLMQGDIVVYVVTNSIWGFLMIFIVECIQTLVLIIQAALLYGFQDLKSSGRKGAENRVLD